MRVISIKKLREFWLDPHHPNSENALRGWYQIASEARWKNFAEVRKTYSSADVVGTKTVFNVGGNNYRVIAVIDYDGQKIFVRHVLTHKEYDKGRWKKDPFKWVRRPKKG